MSHFLQTAAEACLWASLAVVAYVYLLYPAAVWALSRCFGRRARPPVSTPDADLPRLSLLIAAYNEEAEIEARVRNALAMDYPRDRLEIVVASDGSTDRTAEIVRRFAGQGVRLLDYRPRRGKASVLNRAFAELTGEVVMLSDANSHTDPGAARALVRWFRDPAVGVVCGRLVLTDPATGHNSDGLYWKYETFLKRCEGRLGALLGVNGALYAIRRGLFAPLPEGTVIDDMVLPLGARLRTGCALVYDGDAVAREETAPGVRAEFHRRARFGAGGFQTLGQLWRLLDPRRGWVAFTFLSHKVLRWLCPLALLGAAAANLALAGLSFYTGVVVEAGGEGEGANLALADQSLYLGLLAGQAGFYLTALGAAFLPGRSAPVRVLRLATLFVGMNAALLVGLGRWLSGTQSAAWRRTGRAAETAAAAAAERPTPVVLAAPQAEPVS
jgi:cellulose synthase/poly-beta-1,6-N-acetylglucosamine synthase-like glycosyltransferase